MERAQLHKNKSLRTRDDEAKFKFEFLTSLYHVIFLIISGCCEVSLPCGLRWCYVFPA